MKRYLTTLLLLAGAASACAQKPVTVGDVINLEEAVLIKKMNEELAKPDPNAPPLPPPVKAPKPQKIVHPTRALAVYGTTATAYEGHLSMSGVVHVVRIGSRVENYIVTHVAPHGIELTMQADEKTGRRGSAKRGSKTQTMFVPVYVR